MDINLDVIKELINSLDNSSVGSLRLETKDFKLSLERSSNTVITSVPTVSAEVQPAVQSDQTAQEEVHQEPCGTVVKSPIVGTFYESSSPDKPPFVQLGQTVKRGDTLFIVESMKLMNEIASEYDGTIAEIYVKNGQAVEFGQPIMRIE